jgi:hypothetical protein
MVGLSQAGGARHPGSADEATCNKVEAVNLAKHQPHQLRHEFLHSLFMLSLFFLCALQFNSYMEVA